MKHSTSFANKSMNSFLRRSDKDNTFAVCKEWTRIKFPQLICFFWPVTVCSHIKSLVSSEFPLESPTWKMLMNFFYQQSHHQQRVSEFTSKALCTNVGSTHINILKICLDAVILMVCWLMGLTDVRTSKVSGWFWNRRWGSNIYIWQHTTYNWGALRFKGSTRKEK